MAPIYPPSGEGMSSRRSCHNILPQRPSSCILKGVFKGKNKDRVVLNVGGITHEPHISTLMNIPNTAIGNILLGKTRVMFDYNPDTGEYFFDRHPEAFTQVLNYFQTGKLHCPLDMCGPMFEEELKFWGIEEQQMEFCCWNNYTSHREAQKDLKMFEPMNRKSSRAVILDVEEGTMDQFEIEMPKPSVGEMYRQRIWEVLEEPWSSTAASYYSWISLGFIVLSILTFSIYTDFDKKMETCRKVAGTNVTSNGTAFNSTGGDSKTICELLPRGKPFIIIRALEYTCTVWFTLEIIVRFLFCPSKLQFIKETYNWMDVIAVIPVYLFLFLKPSDIIDIFNMLRLLRIFKFFKRIYALQVLGKTIKASASQLLTLLCVLLIPAILISSLMFFIEHNWGNTRSKGEYKDVPNSAWWAIITMTTVGYGESDMTPGSNVGRFIAGAAAILGVLILSLTTSILGSTFQSYYNLAKTQLKIPENTRRKIRVVPETMLSIAGKALVAQEESKSSLDSANSKMSERDSGYGNSPMMRRQTQVTWNGHGTCRTHAFCVPSFANRKKEKLEK